MNHPLRILNLERNRHDAELNLEALTARWPDCHFVRVDNRDEFLRALAESRLDIILSEYNLRGFNGREALARAQQLRPEIPFVFVSGTIGEDDAIEALKRGAADVVHKPGLLRLIPAVSRALRESERLTESLRAEEILRQAEHKYRELFENLDEAAILTDERSGTILEVNRRAEEMLGCFRAAILGRKQSVFLAPGESAPEADDFAAETQAAADSESQMIRNDGTVIPVRVHLTRLMLYGQSLILKLCHAESSEEDLELAHAAGC
jgi:PAS domain S-box-containing protein